MTEPNEEPLPAEKRSHKKQATPTILPQTAVEREVEAYWRQEGHPHVRVWRHYVKETVAGRSVTYVRTFSNLINGSPPPKGAAAAAEESGGAG